MEEPVHTGRALGSLLTACKFFPEHQAISHAGLELVSMKIKKNSTDCPGLSSVFHSYVSRPQSSEFPWKLMGTLGSIH